MTTDGSPMTPAEAVLAAITQGVSAVAAAVDGGLDLIPEVAILKPYIDALNGALQAIGKIAASNAALAAKLAAAQVVTIDAAAKAEEDAKFPTGAT